MSYRVIQPKAVNINCDKHACRMCPFVVRSMAADYSWECRLFNRPLTMTPMRMPRRCDECRLAEVKEGDRETVCHDCAVVLESVPVLCESCVSKRNAEGMDTDDWRTLEEWMAT